MTALEDQQVAGVVMWVAGEVLYVAIGAALFARWVNSTTPPPLLPREERAR
ncbi:MAG: cytochrome c oxidase assembly protein [Hyphomicrobiales bacterium]